MKPADDDFFWFITFLTDEVESTETAMVHEAMGIVRQQTTINLWCCRRCGSMVHGGHRSTHKQFHLRLRAAGIE